MQVDMQTLGAEIDALALHSETPAPSVTRVLWTKQDMAGRAELKGLIEAAGLAWREDALGNLFARWEGSDPDLPAVATGSHTDAIPHAGKYDGVVGVLGGLEAIRALKREGFMPRRSIELIAFTAEEPTRFGVGCLGSRAMSGALTTDALRALRDADGMGLEDARAAVGYTTPLETVQLTPGAYSAFVELHIEQGPELERAGLPIGLVTAIAAPASLMLHLTGEGGHAGARLMPGRKDAFLAAAEIALAVERVTLATGALDAVGTAGLVQVHPNAINSIPSSVTLGLDLRDIDAARRDESVRQVMEAAREVCARRGIELRLDVLNADPPAISDPAVLAAGRDACAAEGLPFMELPSRAYHDTLFMARLCPVGMIFIPCRGGVSHRPDEYASPEAIAAGVRVLAGTLAALAR